jgi:HEAT repeat protein
LRSPTVSSELRVAALEGLSEAKGDPSAFLVSMASDLDPDVRTAAAWALSATDASGKAGTQLLGLLQGESDASVRLRLYEALGNQENADVSSVMAAVQNEKDPSARIAGLDLLAKTLRDNPSPQLQTFFDQTAIPELKQTALTGTSKSDQMAAVVALTRANSDPAMQALQDVAQNSNNPAVRQSAGSVLANRPQAASK